MTYISNTFSDFAKRIEKLYTIEVHTFDGDVEIVDIYAYDAESAQSEASDMVGNVDYMVILFANIA